MVAVVSQIAKAVRAARAANSKAALSAIQRRRAVTGERPGLSFGEVMLTIPPDDLRRLTAAYPDLAAPDAEIRTKAWQRFANSPEARPYRASDNPHRRF